MTDRSRRDSARIVWASLFAANALFTYGRFVSLMDGGNRTEVFWLMGHCLAAGLLIGKFAYSPRS